MSLPSVLQIINLFYNHSTLHSMWIFQFYVLIILLSVHLYVVLVYHYFSLNLINQLILLMLKTSPLNISTLIWTFHPLIYIYKLIWRYYKCLNSYTADNLLMRKN